VGKLALQGHLHGFVGSVGKGEKIVNGITSISATNPIITCHEEIHNL